MSARSSARTLRKARLGGADQRAAALLGAMLQQGDGFRNEDIQRYLAFHQHKAAGFDLGEIQNIVDQGQKMRAGTMDQAGIFDVAMDVIAKNPGLDDLGKTENRVQGCAQFMAHVGQELRLGLIGLFGLQAFLFGHLSGVPQFADQAALLDQKIAVLVSQQQCVCCGGMDLAQNGKKKREIDKNDKRECLMPWGAHKERRPQKTGSDDGESGQGQRQTGPKQGNGDAHRTTQGQKDHAMIDDISGLPQEPGLGCPGQGRREHRRGSKAVAIALPSAQRMPIGLESCGPSRPTGCWRRSPGQARWPAWARQIPRE